jgi:hypothetical protein
MPYLVAMCIIPKNYFVAGHDVIYTKMRHSCPQATTVVVENDVCHLEDVGPPTTAVWGRIYKAKAFEMKDRKRKDVHSSASEENFSQKFPGGVRNDCKFLQKKKKAKNRSGGLSYSCFLHF